MNASDRHLMISSLLGEASPEDTTELDKRLGASADLREKFLDHLDIEAFLRSEAKAGAFVEDKALFFAQLEARGDTGKVVPFSRRAWHRTVLTLTTAAACIAVGFMIFGSRPLSAAGALEKLVYASLRAGDRTYAVSVPRGDAERPGPGGRQVNQEGAKLYLRGIDHYVVVQDLLNAPGQKFTGFDGQQSWTFAGEGPVTISDDPNQFRRDLPGAQLDIPFLNLHEQLEELHVGYEITLTDDERSGNFLLRALKKSRDLMGPREILIWFEPESGVIQRLELRRPVDGVRRVLRLDLVEQSPLPPEFFSHAAHHEPEREVREARPRRRLRPEQ